METNKYFTQRWKWLTKTRYAFQCTQVFFGFYFFYRFYAVITPFPYPISGFTFSSHSSASLLHDSGTIARGNKQHHQQPIADEERRWNDTYPCGEWYAWQMNMTFINQLASSVSRPGEAERWREKSEREQLFFSPISVFRLLLGWRGGGGERRKWRQRYRQRKSPSGLSWGVPGDKSLTN